MTKEFEEIFKKVIGHEGGYVDDKDDRGGETKYGVSKKAYPNVDIKNLTLENAQEIYYTDYWLKSRTDVLAKDIRYIHFDSCINHGVHGALKIMQQSAGCKYIDGIVGNETLSKAKSISIHSYAYYRLLKFVRIVIANPSQIRFLRGWSARIENIVKDITNNK
jgi:lysozyme family protein